MCFVRYRRQIVYLIVDGDSVKVLNGRYVSLTVKAHFVVHQVLNDAIGAALVFARQECGWNGFGVADGANGVVRGQCGLGHERFVSVDKINQAFNVDDFLPGNVCCICFKMV